MSILVEIDPPLCFFTVFYPFPHSNYLEVGLLDSSHWSNVGVLKTTWAPPTIQRMMTCCLQLKLPHLAAILSQFSSEVDYGKALTCVESAAQLDLFELDHLKLIWDIALQELVVAVFKKKGNQEKLSAMVSVPAFLCRPQIRLTTIDPFHRYHFSSKSCQEQTWPRQVTRSSESTPQIKCT